MGWLRCGVGVLSGVTPLFRSPARAELVPAACSSLTACLSFPVLHTHHSRPASTHISQGHRVHTYTHATCVHHGSHTHTPPTTHIHTLITGTPCTYIHPQHLYTPQTPRTHTHTHTAATPPTTHIHTHTPPTHKITHSHTPDTYISTCTIQGMVLNSLLRAQINTQHLPLSCPRTPPGLRAPVFFLFWVTASPSDLVLSGLAL